MENHHFQWTKSTINHHFQIAMLVYQRVIYVYLPTHQFHIYQVSRLISFYMGKVDRERRETCPNRDHVGYCASCFLSASKVMISFKILSSFCFSITWQRGHDGHGVLGSSTDDNLKGQQKITTTARIKACKSSKTLQAADVPSKPSIESWRSMKEAAGGTWFCVWEKSSGPWQRM